MSCHALPLTVAREVGPVRITRAPPFKDVLCQSAPVATDSQSIARAHVFKHLAHHMLRENVGYVIWSQPISQTHKLPTVAKTLILVRGEADQAPAVLRCQSVRSDPSTEQSAPRPWPPQRLCWRRRARLRPMATPTALWLTLHVLTKWPEARKTPLDMFLHDARKPAQSESVHTSRTGSQGRPYVDLSHSLQRGVAQISRDPRSTPFQPHAGPTSSTTPPSTITGRPACLSAVQPRQAPLQSILCVMARAARRNHPIQHIADLALPTHAGFR